MMSITIYNIENNCRPQYKASTIFTLDKHDNTRYVYGTEGIVFSGYLDNEIHVAAKIIYTSPNHDQYDYFFHSDAIHNVMRMKEISDNVSGSSCYCPIINYYGFFYTTYGQYYTYDNYGTLITFRTMFPDLELSMTSPSLVVYFTPWLLPLPEQIPLTAIIELLYDYFTMYQARGTTIGDVNIDNILCDNSSYRYYEVIDQSEIEYVYFKIIGGIKLYFIDYGNGEDDSPPEIFLDEFQELVDIISDKWAAHRQELIKFHNIQTVDELQIMLVRTMITLP